MVSALAQTDPTTLAAAAIALVLGLGVGSIGAWLWLSHLRAVWQRDAARSAELARAEAEASVERVRADAERMTIAERERLDGELQTQRDELRDIERRLGNREEQQDRRAAKLDERDEQLDRRSEKLERRGNRLARRETELADLVEQTTLELARVGEMSLEEARTELLQRAELVGQEEADATTRRIIEQAENSAQERAKEITLMAIQRYAGEHVAEVTTRVLTLPSDEMKGRVIGREGRNIRAIEAATGVDLIIDDTPGVITISCFDKVRQTIAFEALTRLVEDGRIHPARIEEVVNKVKGEIDQRIQQQGKDAAEEASVRNLHPKLIETMGRLGFRTSYGQNVLKHSIEVAYLSQLIADQLGLNGRTARRCGFLHDIGKAIDHESEGSHTALGMSLAEQFGEKDPVLNAIGGHHFDIPTTSPYTVIVSAADALSGARPGARRESLEHYIKRLDALQTLAQEHDGVQQAYAIQAGREVRVIVDAKKVSDDRAHAIARDIANRVSAEMNFPGEIKVTVLRETRAIEIAR
ncbi:MAG: ribonuclease Y [Phycisphaerales bacterium]|nr:ribonuclease Y [Phycisphaerales bacterium]